MKRYTLLLAVTVLVLASLACLSLMGGGDNDPEIVETPMPTLDISSTSQPENLDTPVPTLDIGSTMIGEDGMTLVYVPAGEFTMGSDADDASIECQKYYTKCERDRFTDEEPPHLVDLAAFWIDQTEVTNGMYAKCVADGACQKPTLLRSYTHFDYFGISEFADYPVIYVDWNMANAYCSWADRRLPTEAEWEKAARGVNGNIFPWGNESPNANLLNYNDDIDNKTDDDTTEVGNYADGASIYGALDMAGNVWEWVNDWYSETYYKSSPPSNPLGPDTGEKRVLRGGAWNSLGIHFQSAYREKESLDYTGFDVGFRCARVP